jgi:hypothetical protein
LGTLLDFAKQYGQAKLQAFVIGSTIDRNTLSEAVNSEMYDPFGFDFTASSRSCISSLNLFESSGAVRH